MSDDNNNGPDFNDGMWPKNEEAEVSPGMDNAGANENDEELKRRRAQQDEVLRHERELAKELHKERILAQQAREAGHAAPGSQVTDDTRARQLGAVQNSEQTDYQAGGPQDNQQDVQRDNQQQDVQPDGQVDNQADSQVDNQADGQVDNQADGQADNQMGGQADNQMGGQVDYQADNPQDNPQDNQQQDVQPDNQAGYQTDNPQGNQQDNPQNEEQQPVNDEEQQNQVPGDGGGDQANVPALTSLELVMSKVMTYATKKSTIIVIAAVIIIGVLISSGPLPTLNSIKGLVSETGTGGQQAGSATQIEQLFAASSTPATPAAPIAPAAPLALVAPAAPLAPMAPLALVAPTALTPTAPVSVSGALTPPLGSLSGSKGLTGRGFIGDDLMGKEVGSTGSTGSTGLVGLANPMSTGASPTGASLVGLANPTGASPMGASLVGANPTGANPVGAAMPATPIINPVNDKLIASQHTISLLRAEILRIKEVFNNRNAVSLSTLSDLVEKTDKLQSNLKLKTAKLEKTSKARKWLGRENVKLKAKVKLLMARGVFAGWEVVGITHSGVALKSSQGSVQVIQAGDTFEGVKVLKILPAESKVITNVGTVVKKLKK